MANRLIVTCMRNEGPFILDWLAHHLSIGFDHVLVFTNDCTDGTVELLDTLAAAGMVTHMENPYQRMGGSPNPQLGALKYAASLPLVQAAEWLMVADVDEYLDIHVGAGTLDDLFEASGDADAISMQWRLFGNSDIDMFEDRPLAEQFTLCAPLYCPVPLQAWATKTLFRGLISGGGLFGKMGVHRPFQPSPSRPLHWVNGSGIPVHPDFVEKGWRFGIRDHGYALATVNHYAVRSAESFLVKRDRGRVNHILRDQGLAYWTRMNFNMERADTIRRHDARRDAARQILDILPGVADRHAEAVAHHRAKIQELLGRPDMQTFYAEITRPERKLLSRHLNLFNRAQLEDGLQDVSSDLMDRLATVPVLH